jgi:hypothetical protein
MSDTNAAKILLGPQRPTRNLAEAFETDGVPDGRVAVISAGWQEAEADIDDVAEAIGRPLLDLRLYQRAEALFEREPGLGDAYRARQDRLKRQQRLYRLRLKQLSLAARQIMSAEGDADMIAAEQRHAIAQLRALDRHHLHRSEAMHREFDQNYNESSCTPLAEHIAEIRTALDGCGPVLITGGNVVILINRLRLFGLEAMLRERVVVAWSAGAMALASQIVLFHDRTPQGRRDPEVLGAGLNLVPGFVLLPNAERRLRHRDRLRMGLLSRRFSPDAAITLDSGSLLRIEAGRITAANEVRRLRRTGTLARVKPS